jgi:hypothetical protein
MKPPLGADWYEQIPGVIGVRDTGLGRRLPARLVESRAFHGLVLLALSRTHPKVAIWRHAPGWHVLLLGRALLGRRPKLVVLQLIVHPPRSRVRRLRARIDRWALRRAMLHGHALDSASLDSLPQHYGLPAERFTYVPWFLLRTPDVTLAGPPEPPLVVAGGRSYCDWPTLFEAASGAGWPLEVVCSGADRAVVEPLARAVGARVHCELERQAYDALLSRASVLAVVLRDEGIPQGHVRIMDAATHGVPLVVTATGSVEDYVRDAETALVVGPGDAAAVREAIDRLLTDRALAERLRTAALERGRGWHIGHYLACLGDLVAGRPVRLPPDAPQKP